MASSEREPGVPPPAAKYITSAGTLALVLAVGGCIEYQKNFEEPSEVTTDAGINDYPTLVPDLGGFLKLGTDDTCAGGGKRPCAVLIRSEPFLESSYVNARPAQRRVDWPLESYKDEPGDKVLIDCYRDSGQMVYALDGSSASPVWYRIIVEPEHIADRERRDNTKDGLGPTVQYGGQTALYAWAAAEWFGHANPDPAIKPC